MQDSSPTSVTCKDCGLTYVPDVPEDRDSHAVRHGLLMETISPNPLPNFQSRGTRNPMLVTADSPSWAHFQMYGRALAFLQELNVGFLQWGAHGAPHATARGYLIEDDTGTFPTGSIGGACAFGFANYTHRPATWVMEWAWLAPGARRKGLLTRQLALFQHEFGQFDLAPPLSTPMVNFVRKHGLG
jgi:hypothetical protein